MESAWWCSMLVINTGRRQPSHFGHFDWLFTSNPETQIMICNVYLISLQGLAKSTLHYPCPLYWLAYLFLSVVGWLIAQTYSAYD